MSRDQTIHAVALRGLLIPSGRRRRTATFIHMDKLVTAAAEALSKAEKPSAVPRVTFVRAHPFVMGHLQALEGMPNTMPGDLELSGTVRLGLIRMGVHMTAQRVPIQFARPLWAGTLIRDPVGLQPPVDAGLAAFESPSRRGLAAPHVEHNPPPVVAHLISSAYPQDCQHPPTMSISNCGLGYKAFLRPTIFLDTVGSYCLLRDGGIRTDRYADTVRL
jgi:hypothetical protein